MDNLFERLNLSDTICLTSELILTEIGNLDQCYHKIAQFDFSSHTVYAFLRICSVVKSQQTNQVR